MVTTKLWIVLTTGYFSQLQSIKESQTVLLQNIQKQLSEQNEVISKLVTMIQENQACSPSPASANKRPRLRSPLRVTNHSNSKEHSNEEQSPPENSAFNIMLKPKETYTLEKLSGKSCWEAVRDTYWHRLNDGRKLDSTPLSADDKRRFRFVVEEICRYATPDEKESFEAEIPPRNSSDWITWKNRLEQASLDVTSRAFEALEEREKACGMVTSGKAKKNLVAAMEKRLREVIKKEREKVKQTETSSSVSMNPFMIAANRQQNNA